MVSRQLWGLSPRSWLILAVFTTALLTLVGLPALSDRPDRPDPSAAGPELTPVAPRPDRKLTGGATARLSRCGTRADLYPPARGTGERKGGPDLTVLSWSTNDTAAPDGDGITLTVFAAVRAGERPLRIAAPAFAGRGTVEVVSPFGSGVSASAVGLGATVVEDGPGMRPVRPPASGSHHIAPGKRLLLQVNVPAEAMCPGLNPIDVIACSPEEAESPDEACPTLVLTFTDPAVRAYRAQGSERPPGTFSDRLIGALPNPAVSAPRA
ncbi:hypothetical protein AB0G74_27000 [Streptomyces sp. NPDC020875]|uniref:hypothetical protein n=1 Tax=Streptomyces sp. NPDC020875 TaxID=3154898 RepID=UPI0033DA76E2